MGEATGVAEAFCTSCTSIDLLYNIIKRVP